MVEPYVETKVVIKCGESMELRLPLYPGRPYTLFGRCARMEDKETT